MGECVNREVVDTRRCGNRRTPVQQKVDGCKIYREVSGGVLRSEDRGGCEGGQESGGCQIVCRRRARVPAGRKALSVLPVCLYRREAGFSDQDGDWGPEEVVCYLPAHLVLEGVH